MVVITRKEYGEILDVLEKNCCRYCSPYLCSESYCDIQDIIALLNKHIDDNCTYNEEMPF